MVGLENIAITSAVHSSANIVRNIIENGDEETSKNWENTDVGLKILDMMHSIIAYKYKIL